MGSSSCWCCITYCGRLPEQTYQQWIIHWNFRQRHYYPQREARRDCQDFPGPVLHSDGHGRQCQMHPGTAEDFKTHRSVQIVYFLPPEKKQQDEEALSTSLSGFYTSRGSMCLQTTLGCSKITAHHVAYIKANQLLCESENPSIDDNKRFTHTSYT